MAKPRTSLLVGNPTAQSGKAAKAIEAAMKLRLEKEVAGRFAEQQQKLAKERQALEAERAKLAADGTAASVHADLARLVIAERSSSAKFSP